MARHDIPALYGKPRRMRLRFKAALACLRGRPVIYRTTVPVGWGTDGRWVILPKYVKDIDCEFYFVRMPPAPEPGADEADR